MRAEEMGGGEREKGGKVRLSERRIERRNTME
jgi:hypothetical protein